MYEVLLVVYLLVALALVGLVLIQQGKGADMGASFGAGASNTMFGSSGAGNFLTRSTAVLAIIFFVISLVLGNLSTNQSSDGDDFNDLSESEELVESSAINPAASNDALDLAPASDIPVVDAVEEVKSQPQSDIPVAETAIESTQPQRDVPASDAAE